MTHFDIIIIIILAFFAVRGIFRGFVTELIILVSLILGFAIAFTYFPQLKIILTALFPVLPEFAAQIISFILLFIAVNLVLRMIGKALNKLVHFTFLNPINRLAGGVFGFFKAILLVSLFILLIEQTPFALQIKSAIGADKSKGYTVLKNIAPGVYNLLLKAMPGDARIQQEILDSIQKVDSTTKKLVNPF